MPLKITAVKDWYYRGPCQPSNKRITLDYPDLRELVVGIVTPIEPPAELIDAIRQDQAIMALAIGSSVFALRCMEQFRGNDMPEANADEALTTVLLSMLIASRCCRLAGGDDLLEDKTLARLLQACNLLFQMLLQQPESPISETDLRNAGSFFNKLTSDTGNSPGLAALKTGLDSTLPMIAADPAPVDEHEGVLARMQSFAVQMRTLVQIGELSTRVIH